MSDLQQKMKFSKPAILLVLLSGILTLQACKDGNSVYDPEKEFETDPVIESIIPEDGYLAGIDSVIINGQNFSDDPEEVIVDFGGSPGAIRSISENRIVVRTGLTTGENVPVKVAVRGAEYFSNIFNYKVDPAVYNHPGLSDKYRPVSAMAVDSEESIHGILNIQSVTEFYKITKSGDISVYADRTRFSNYTGAQFGPDGGLYLISPESPNAAIFRMPPGGNAPGSQEGVWAFPPFNEGANFYNLTFDDNGYIWVVGNNENIYRYTFSNKNLKRFPFEARLRTAFVYENELYVAGNLPGSTDQMIWKFDIASNGDLGDAQVVLNYSASGTGTIRDITFDNGGTMYLGIVNGEYGIVGFNLESEKLKPLYPFVVGGNYYTLTWDEDGNIIGGVQSGEVGTLQLNKIDMYDRVRAPIYGID